MFLLLLQTELHTRYPYKRVSYCKINPREFILIASKYLHISNIHQSYF